MQNLLLTEDSFLSVPHAIPMQVLGAAVSETHRRAGEVFSALHQEIAARALPGPPLSPEEFLFLRLVEELDALCEKYGQS